jgi:hypothetical protein
MAVEYLLHFPSRCRRRTRTVVNTREINRVRDPKKAEVTHTKKKRTRKKENRVIRLLLHCVLWRERGSCSDETIIYLCLPLRENHYLRFAVSRFMRKQELLYLPAALAFYEGFWFDSQLPLPLFSVIPLHSALATT